MEIIWTKPKLTYYELSEQTVEFKIPARGGMVHGLGKFVVRQNPAGLLAVDATTDVQGKDWAERIYTRYHLTQAAVDRIALHPDQTKAKFLLV